MSNTIERLCTIAGAITVTVGATVHLLKKNAKKNTCSAEIMPSLPARKRGIYEKYVKRGLDVFCASTAIVCFSPLYLGVAGLVKLKIGSPVLFVQYRPGLIDSNGKETIFKMYKFRTMTDEKNEYGELLPDEERLTEFGAWLRSTSLDELPEAFNILEGTMSVVGPRPQLVKDMTFMNERQRLRHTAKPGLSGLAQIRGRNDLAWEEKLDWDLKYIERINVVDDCKIVIETIRKAFIDKEGITEKDMATAEDYGDYLLHNKIISITEYEEKKELAKAILSKGER